MFLLNTKSGLKITLSNVAAGCVRLCVLEVFGIVTAVVSVWNLKC